MTTYAKQRTQIPALRQIGVWATLWWGASGVYLLTLVWQARGLYRLYTGGGFSFHMWMTAIHDTFRDTRWLQVLLAVVVLGWILGGYMWLRTLRRHNVSYQAALKDLFLTIRK